MSLQTTITGSGHGRDVDVHSASTPITDYNGLVVYTEELQTRRFFDGVLAAEDGSIALNTNPAVAGTNTLVHNGTDTVAWTASASTGSWTFNSTAQAYDGTRSIDATSGNDNDVAVFTAPAPVSTTGLQEVSLWVYISKWTTNGTKNVNVGLRSGGVDVGNQVGLDAYINISNTGAWQKAVIPFAAFNVVSATLSDLTISIEAAGGPAPDVYLDLIELSTASTTQAFSLGPDREKIWELHSFRFTLVSTGTALDYNSFLGVSSLSNGLLIQAFRAEAPTSFTASNLAELLSIPDATVSVVQGTANNTVTVDVSFPDRTFFLHGNEDDKLIVTVRDDLSTLPFFRVSVRISDLTLT